MKAIRIPNDGPETWSPTMPTEDDVETPLTPPCREMVVRDLTPIDERGQAELPLNV